jgi:pyrimidine-nucleoside phosphorylase
MLTALGGRDVEKIIADPSLLCQARKVLPAALGKDGYIGDIAANKIGEAAQLLGAGRETKADVIDPAVGILLCKRRGELIRADEPFAQIYVNDESRLGPALERLREAVRVTNTPPAALPLVYGEIGF